jgi:uncharacterized membrane protein YdjX (TVP38/TMEM64 family)
MICTKTLSFFKGVGVSLENDRGKLMEQREQKDQPETVPRPEVPSAPFWRPLLFLAALLLLLAAARLLGLGERLGAVRGWLADLGPWGPLVYVIIYVGATVAAVPGSALTVAGGALFGSFWGVILAHSAATLGAALAFLLGRYLARDAVERWLAASPQFQRLARLTAEHGVVIVALTRLVPIFPFNLLNYGFGLTRVPFLTYLFWSWLCMLPGAILYVVGADAVAQTLTQGRVPWKMAGLLAVLAAAVAGLVRIARRRLEAKEAARGAGLPPEGEN